MKVILLKDVRNVGRKDEIKDVSDGFANNFLLRQNLAIAASPDRVAVLEKKRAETEERQEERDEALDGTVRSLSGDRIAITVRATPTGGLFKSITVSDIVRNIKEQKHIEIPENSIELPRPLKTAGEHAIGLHSKNARGTMILAIIAAQ